MTNEPLLSEDLARKLNSLMLAVSRPTGDTYRGRRRGPLIDTSVEFADVRNYAVGDDFRQVDWNAFARLERLFIRLYSADHGLRASILLDTSRSMLWGQPSKADFTKRIAVALAYVGIMADDRVSIAGFSDKIHSYLPGQIGRMSMKRVINFVSELPVGGRTDLNIVLVEVNKYKPSSNLVVILTDLLGFNGYQRGLRSLVRRKQEVVLIQVLSPEEMEPKFSGNIDLLDDEEEISVGVMATSSEISNYRNRLNKFIGDASAFCKKHRIIFGQLRSDLSIEEAVLRFLNRTGILV